MEWSSGALAVASIAASCSFMVTGAVTWRKVAVGGWFSSGVGDSQPRLLSTRMKSSGNWAGGGGLQPDRRSQLKSDSFSSFPRSRAAPKGSCTERWTDSDYSIQHSIRKVSTQLFIRYVTFQCLELTLRNFKHVSIKKGPSVCLYVIF